MNGRIYDPLIGRMLSADIVVQAPGNLQSYNRYTYVNNNPLSLVDPSGFFWEKVWGSVKNWYNRQIEAGEKRVNQAAVGTAIQSAVSALGLGTAAANGTLTQAQHQQIYWHAWNSLSNNLDAQYEMAGMTAAANRASEATERVTLDYVVDGWNWFVADFNYGAQQTFQPIARGFEFVRSTVADLAEAAAPYVGFPTGGATAELAGGAFDGFAAVGGIEASVGKILGAGRSVISVESVAINPRLAGRLDAWRSYVANGGTLDMKSWVSATQRQYGGVSGGYWSGYADWARSVESIHGNSAMSSRLAYLYRLDSSAGEFLKWGISQNPAKRYSGTFMLDKQMTIIDSGARSQMLRLERTLTEAQPGPLNFEPWAGAAR